MGSGRDGWDEPADRINDGKFMFNPGEGPFASEPEKWGGLPASYHNSAGCFSIADGHSMIHHWQDRRTIWPIIYHNYSSSSTTPKGIINLGASLDYTIDWMITCLTGPIEPGCRRRCFLFAPDSYIIFRK